MKKLYRSRKDRMLGGVCGGIAEYFNIDPVIVRIVAVAFFFAGGSAVLAYIIGLIVIPNEPSGMPVAENKVEPAPLAMSAAAPQAAPSSSNAVPLALGIVLIVIGTIFLLHNIPFFNPYYWQVWRFTRNFFWPSLLIAFGIFIIARGWKK